VESLLKTFEQSSTRSQISTEDINTLRRENADLKKQLKELKQSYILDVSNPSEADLKGGQVGKQIINRNKMHRAAVP